MPRQISIPPVQTDLSLKQVLIEDFNLSPEQLPISGGWGYTREDAILFEKPPHGSGPPVDYVGLEYDIV